MTAPTSELQATRYGQAPQQKHRGWQISVAAVLVIAIAFIAWWAFQPADTPVNPRTISYQVVDSTRTDVIVSVIPDESREIVCGIEARSDQHAPVGYREITFPADPQATTEREAHQTVQLRTTQIADSGLVSTCWFS